MSEMSIQQTHISTASFHSAPSHGLSHDKGEQVRHDGLHATLTCPKREPTSNLSLMLHVNRPYFFNSREMTTKHNVSHTRTHACGAFFGESD